MSVIQIFSVGLFLKIILGVTVEGTRALFTQALFTIWSLTDLTFRWSL